MKFFSINKKVAKEWSRAILIAFVIALLVRIFIIQSFTITDVRMENTLLPGDHLVINKIKHGARFPVTLLALPFVGEKIPFTDLNSWVDWIQLPYFRIPGFSDFKRNELLAFNYPVENDPPVDHKTIYVKRCVALPGDTIAVIDKKVFINNQMTDAIPGIKYKYRIITDGSELSAEIRTKYEMFDGEKINQIGIYDYYMTAIMADKLAKEPFIKNVRQLKIVRGYDYITYFPQNRYVAWNLDYFGPVVVPAAGAKVKLDYKNIAVYERIIRDYEGNKLDIQENHVMINGKRDSLYTFKQNYYFVMDDNRDNAKDARIWGFLPENHIIGNVSFIWFSIEKPEGGASHVRWDRFLKIIE
jgi:signal peptidase I